MARPKEKSAALERGSPGFTLSHKPGTLVIVARGRWTAQWAQMLESQIAELATDGEDAKTIEFDAGGVEEFDTYGVWLVERLRRELTAAGYIVKLTNMRPGAQPLFDEIASVNLEEPEPRHGRADLAKRIAGRIEELAGDLTGFTRMLGATAIALLRELGQPRRFRYTATVHQFDRVGWRALPIVLLVTAIIGAIIAQQGFFHFSEFGADLYVIDMIGFLIMREIGVLLVSIMVAGRSGSAFTAELGSMKMREEIDALRTMGLDPVAVLVMPRTLALVIALPILTFIGSMAALAGAGLVAVLYAGLSPELFIDRLREAISLDHLRVGLIKAPFIGLVIGIIACMEGFRVAGSTTSLGRHTTQSVVKAIFMVIVLDGLFALFFSGIGM